jgi:phospholipid/cholesterol/gamma-HCH transport system substrate-binding protein
MNVRSSDVKVGIAVIVAAVILILAVAWIGQFRVNRHWVPYSVRFREVGGLSAGDGVSVSGVDMGKVARITLGTGYVTIDLLLDERVTLRQDCSIEIRSVGLMGERYIYISPGTTGEKIAPGATIEGSYTAGLADLSGGMQGTMEEVKALSESLRKLVGYSEGGTTLAQTLSGINAASGEILALLKENREDLKGTTRSLRSASASLDEILSGHKADITSGIANFAQASARLDSLALSLKEVTASLERGDGTLGMLIKEKKLHEDLETTLENLNELLKDIKEHPERYIKLRIF